jgi:hypothetical protein
VARRSRPSARIGSRKERLEELAQRERDRPTPRAAAVDTFWTQVDALLERSTPGLARERREAEANERMIDAVEAARADTLRAERERLSSWLLPDPS